MNDQRKKEQDSEVRDQEIRAALDQHWAVSDANDSSDSKPLFARLTSALFLYVASTAGSLA